MPPASAAAETVTKPYVPGTPDSRGCVTLVDAGWADELKRLAGQKLEGQLRFAGRVDLVFPGSDKETRALNGMAILAASVMSPGVEGFPIDKAYLLEPGSKKILNLPRVFPLSPLLKLPDGHPMAERFGGYRQDVYFLVPLSELARNVEVIALMAGTKAGVSLGRFPAKLPKGLQAARLKKLKVPDPKGHADPLSVLRLIRERFCIDFGT